MDKVLMAEVMSAGGPPVTDAEQAAIGRDEAGLYRLSEQDEAAFDSLGELPRHPDPAVVVVPYLYGEPGTRYVRWYRP